MLFIASHCRRAINIAFSIHIECLIKIKYDKFFDKINKNLEETREPRDAAVVLVGLKFAIDIHQSYFRNENDNKPSCR